MIMCLISGLSTAIGGVFILMMKTPSFKVLGYMLGFSSGVMIYISFMDLLPEAIEQIGFLDANLWFFMGIVFFALIIKFVPEADEHEGHKAVTQPETSTTSPTKKNGADKSKDEAGKKHQQKQKKDAYLKNLGIVTALGISLHNFPEGVAVYLSCLKGIQVGLPLMLAIAAHNIPEGMAVAAPIYTATGSKWQAFKYCLLSGLCEPLGAIIFGWVFKDYMTPYLVQSMLAAVAGIMIFMVVKELMPATLKYTDVSTATYSNFIGMFAIFLSVYWLHGMLPHDHGDAAAADHGHSHGAHSHSHGGHSHSHGGDHGHSHGGHSHGHAH
eukprot:gene14960-17688_t